MSPMAEGSAPNPVRMIGADAFSGENRERLSGPALRTFLNIAGSWGLSEEERLAILGQPGRSTLFNWAAKARRQERLSLPLDTLMRISAVLGIHKALGILFPDRTSALRWLRSPNSGPAFGGQAPMSIMVFGTQDGLLQVRRHLDAWCGGTFAPPAGALEGEPPLDDDDIIIV